MGESSAAIDGHRLRPEIQALRALAVTLVVLYHLWPDRLAGGYIGVDVFFVISGFLITSHIVRSIQSGNFSLRKFYARRVRRLLPASLLVLMVVGLVTLVAVPQTLWLDYGRQIVGSALYVQNWVLATDSVDYLALGANPSPVQHYWSLSIEEQFYIVWPLLLLITAVVARKAKARVWWVILSVVAIASIASFTYSILETAANPAAAYFVTPTRAWEFGLGGIASLVLATPVKNAVVGAMLGWGGFAVILGTALVYDAATPFPGSAAVIPVIATVAVIAAGDVRRWWAPSIVANRRPVQLLGDISYSVYLWHWPLIVLVLILVSGVGSQLTTPMKLGILIASIGLGWASKRFVEDRFRSPAPARQAGDTRRVFVATVAGMTVVAAVGATSVVTVSTQVAATESELAEIQSSEADCFGAAAMEEGAVCGPSTETYPSPLTARGSAEHQDCQQRANRSALIVCEFGSDPAESTRKVALVGDSHANQWLPAVEAISEQEGWALSTFFRSSCTFSTAPRTDPTCSEWNDSVAHALADGSYDMVIVTGSTNIFTIAGGSTGQYDAAVIGYADAWASLTATGASISVIADTPAPRDAGLGDPATCAFENIACSFEATTVNDPLIEAAGLVPGVGIVDMNDFFCTAGDCAAVIGDVLVYRDNNHMTAVYARTLAPYLNERLADMRT